MIQYDRDMSVNDIVNYWAGGFVLYRPGASWPWDLATVAQSDEGGIRLYVYAKDRRREPIPKNVSRNTFFDEVILHRPPVNLVQYAGVVYRLTWAPPDRTQNRSLSEGAITVKRLAPVMAVSTSMTLALRRHQRDFVLFENTRPAQAFFAKKGGNPAGLTLLLAHVNRRELDPVGDIMRRVMRKTGTAELISSDEWVNCQELNTIELYAGARKLCSIARQHDGELEVVGGLGSVSSVWLPTVTRHLAAGRRAA